MDLEEFYPETLMDEEMGHTGGPVGRPTLMHSLSAPAFHDALKAAKGTSAWCGARNANSADRTTEARFGLAALGSLAEEEEQEANKAAQGEFRDHDAVHLGDRLQLVVQQKAADAEAEHRVEIASESSDSSSSLPSVECAQESCSSSQTMTVSSNPYEEEETCYAPRGEGQKAALPHIQRTPSSLWREDRARQAREALARSSVAREEREAREHVRSFLAEHGYRHVRARCVRTTFAKTYPLHCAVSQNDTDMVKLLLQIRADPSQVNGWSQTPLQYALKRNNRLGSHVEVIELLENAEPGKEAKSIDNKAALA
eukprot:CAMPEP_0206465032 /NCGR_PEP_ID=MMETSP0324_2-20121206/27579_1 /ASSEMBLY_ACC=CAM_ASM_000836 /TAXON_ID=2866 /ORGANISM="Crypthecodinium cohnii, Strain Seligo" /LENGTH=312 /DNA_ID=CAMNT_0053937795 /DNA_START=210 /DNA_END=1148 /DNA_ORIENTATION=+